MYLKKIKQLSDRGDTIVEVLLAIGVITLILSGAFVTTNHSLQGERESQERVSALKLIESQVEQAKSISATNAASLFPPKTTSPFCIIGGVVSYNTSCIVDISGNPNPSAVEPAFHLSI